MPDFNINSTYGVIIIQQLKAVYVDENYAKIYGYQNADELLNNVKSFLDLIPTNLHALAKKNYYEITSGIKFPRGHTFTNIDRHGKEFTVFSLDHVIDWEGEKALQVTVIDLSMVIEANKKVREEDLMFRQLVMNSGQGIVVHRDFKPLMFNQAWAKVMRAESYEQAAGVNSIMQFIPENKQQAVRDHYADILSGRVAGKSMVAENICFDGSRRFFNVYDNLIEWEGEPAVQVILEDFTDKVRLEQVLAHRASHDQLTDLLNRSAIYDWLKIHLQSAANMHCVLLDIDNFKKINDSYGHYIGDQVIKSLSKIIKEAVLPFSGVAGRWGGEEFIAFLPNASLEETLSMAETIRCTFNKFKNQYDLGSFYASVSIGISSNNNFAVSDSIDALIKQADRHLYLAKSRGKNCVVNDAIF